MSDLDTASPVAARLDAEEKVLRAALAVLSSERHLADEQAVPMRGLRKAQDRLAEAARALVKAIDAMPMDKRPRGWTT